MDRRYFSCAALASYDDSEPPANPGRAFSQEEVNRLLADDRRKHQARIDRVQRTLEEVSASKNLSVKEREQLATQLEAMAAENRTREEQLVHERTQLEKQHAQALADEKKNTDDGASGSRTARFRTRWWTPHTEAMLSAPTKSCDFCGRARGSSKGQTSAARGLATTRSSSIFPTPTSRAIRPPARYLARGIGDDAGKADLRQPLQVEPVERRLLQALGLASCRVARSTFAI